MVKTESAMLENFIRENQNALYRLAFSYMHNKDDAMDCVSEAIVIAFTKIHTLKKIEAMKSWVYRILINVCISMLRKRKRNVALEDASLIDATTDKNNVDRSEIIAIQTEIKKLPPKLKTVIILRFYEDMKLNEIAEVTGLNVNTCKSRLYRALKILKINLDEGEYDNV